jgi:hypothetical protein
MPRPCPGICSTTKTKMQTRVVSYIRAVMVVDGGHQFRGNAADHPCLGGLV